VLKDRLHCPGLGQVGKDDAAAAARAGEHVVPEDAPEQVCPGDARCAPKQLRPRAARVGADGFGHVGCDVFGEPGCRGAGRCSCGFLG